MPKLTPIGQEKVQLTANVDSQVKVNAKVRAERDGISISALIQQCLEAYGNGVDYVMLDNLLDNR